MTRVDRIGTVRWRWNTDVEGVGKGFSSPPIRRLVLDDDDVLVVVEGDDVSSVERLPWGSSS